MKINKLKKKFKVLRGLPLELPLYQKDKVGGARRKF